ncbi:hypothetical protein [Catenuloplanes atrovinosus]|uniref:Uncharacterized protein n=1 Tax=Catenuloplanes atrovinosus TaxID=137266 RepID=A0AAE3YSK8_9ACTN|nr:hypothetical protein [Catenuloplanes atrovinosus]MDR7277071.1 hypothetical protein [Catenuloplanes atrovinosus]
MRLTRHSEKVSIRADGDKLAELGDKLGDKRFRWIFSGSSHAWVYRSGRVKVRVNGSPYQMSAHFKGRLVARPAPAAPPAAPPAVPPRRATGPIRPASVAAVPTPVAAAPTPVAAADAGPWSGADMMLTGTIRESFNALIWVWIYAVPATVTLLLGLLSMLGEWFRNPGSYIALAISAFLYWFAGRMGRSRPGMFRADVAVVREALADLVGEPRGR